jgi:Ser/Thr protein kinase RdoA (MazF antagonist)
MIPLTVPQDATAVRPTWAELPPQIRRSIEAECGAAVVAAESMGAGFTPGFASRLRLDDGRRVFVKAADDADRRLFADSYREEIRKLGALPDAVPAARLLWSHDADGWVALGLENIDGRHPERPWRSEQLDLVLTTVDAMAEVLTPPPGDYPWSPLADELGGERRWDDITEHHHAPEWLNPYLTECGRLADLGRPALDGDTLVHTDVRDDNVLIDAHDTVWICDWNWPTVGNPAFDSIILLASASGDGHDADAWLARCGTTRDLDAEAVDGILSVLAGYFWTACQEPTPETSPWLRVHQRWYAEATTDWLGRRRRWR